MKHLQISDRQSNFIFYLVHKGKGRTEAARLAGFAAPRPPIGLIYKKVGVTWRFSDSVKN